MNTCNELIEKKTKTAKILLPVVLVSAFLTAVFIICAFKTLSDLFLICYIVSGLTFVICGSIYLTKYLPLILSVNRLREKGLEYVTEDIRLDHLTYLKSKLYCGKWAFFSEKSCQIVPYSDIAWVYVSQQSTYGIVINRSVVIYTKEGKKITLNADVEEIKNLLQNAVIGQNPDVILGYGAEQKAKYRQLYPDGAKAKNMGKVIGGGILLALGAALLISNLVRQTLDGPALIIALPFLVGGGVLLWFGLKK